VTDFDLASHSDHELRYDIAAEAVEMCADEYVAISSEAWATTPLSSDDGPFSLNAQCWHAGPCMLSEMTVGPYAFEIQPVHLDNEGPILVFEKVLSGFEYGERGGGDIYYGPGPIYLHGHKQLGRSIGTRVTVQEFYVLRSMIGLSSDQPAPNKLIYPTSLIGRIVHAEWESVFNAVTKGQSKVTAQTFERLAAALKIALGVNPQREDIRTQSRELLFRQIQRFVVENLDSPDLSVELILREHGVSRASLYRMFETYGGIRTYVTNLRASKAMMDIWQNEAQRGIVRSMQARWGFSSGNDFNRTVRRLFGNTPKRLISGPMASGDEIDQSLGFARDFVDQRWNSASGMPASVAA
jgi:AraC-like DNA-binding protein